MGKIGIFYGSTEGNTEDVADKVKDALGDADVHNVDSASADDLNEYGSRIRRLEVHPFRIILSPYD